MGSTRSAGNLATDFPTDNAHLPATIKQVDYMIQRGELSGAGASQALDAIGLALNALGETIAAPTAAVVGTTGSTSLAYAVVAEYPTTAYQTGVVPTDAMVLAGQPVQGRGPNGLYRLKRYSKISPPVVVSTANATLTGANYVNVTAPTYTGVGVGVTYAVLKSNGNVALSGTWTTANTLLITIGGIACQYITGTNGDTTNTLAAAQLVNVINSTVPNLVWATMVSGGTTIYLFPKNGQQAAVTLAVTSGANITLTRSAATLSGGACLAAGVAPSGVVADTAGAAIGGTTANPIANTDPILPRFCEFGIIPAGAAKYNAAISGTFQSGVAIAYNIGPASGTYTTQSGDTTLAGILTSLAAAMQTTMRANTGGGAGYTAGTWVASTTNLVGTWGATGVGGNGVDVDFTLPATATFNIVCTGTQGGNPANQVFTGGNAASNQVGPRTSRANL